MASKLQQISELSDSTTYGITRSPENWMAFLDTASRVYKYPFNEQVLIYAQKPNATACASIDIWNKKMRRWVNRGTRGIALLDDTGPRLRLKYVFDVADTHPGYNGRTPYLWELKPEQEGALLDHLVDTYGLEPEVASNLPNALHAIAAECVQENMPDMFPDFQRSLDGSLMEELDELNLMVRYREMVTNSVYYTLLRRCGYDPQEFLEPDDFPYIMEYDTLEAVTQIGTATTDTVRPVLIDIGREIRSMELQQTQQQGLATSEPAPYNRGARFSTLMRESTDIGGTDHETEHNTDIHQNRRLPDSEPGSGRAAQRDARQVRDASQDIPEGASERDVPGNAAAGDTDRTPAGDRRNGEQPDRADHGAASENLSGPGQNAGSDGVGRTHEFPAPDGRGERAAGAGLQLNAQEPDTEGTSIPEAEDVTPSASFLLPTFPSAEDQIAEVGDTAAPVMLTENIPQEVLDELLISGGNHKKGPLNIAALYMESITPEERAVLLSRTMGTSSLGIMIDGTDYVAFYDSHGIQIGLGDDIRSAPEKIMISWQDAEQRIQALLDEGHYLPQVILDNAMSNEREEVALLLLHLYNDFDYENHTFGYFDRDEISGGYPEATARMAERLASPEGLTRQITILEAFQQDYQNDRSILRFHYHKIPQLMDRLERLTLADRQFQAAEDYVLHPATRYIPENEIDYFLQSRPLNTKLGIYSCFLQYPDAKRRETYVRESYGTGGVYPALRGNDRSGADYSSKGLKLSLSNDGQPDDIVMLNWSKVARRIDRMIQDGSFLSEEERSHIPEFTREYLAREIYGFCHTMPQELRDTSPLDLSLEFTDAIPALSHVLADPALTAQIAGYMEQAAAQLPEDHRSITQNRRQLADVLAYLNGTFDLFRAQPTAQEVPASQERGTEHQPQKRTSTRTHDGLTQQDNGQLSFMDLLSHDESEAEPEIATDTELQPQNVPAPAPEEPQAAADAEPATPAEGEPIAEDEAHVTPASAGADTAPAEQASAEPESEPDAPGQIADDVLHPMGFPAMEEYNAIKEQHPGHLVGFEQHGYYEFYGEDATRVADILGRNLLEKDLPTGGTVPVTGFKASQWVAASHRLWRSGADVYLAGENPDHTHSLTKELLAQDYVPVGAELQIEGRDFRVESVDFATGHVSLVDLTFMNAMGFPISRVEPLDFVRSFVEEQLPLGLEQEWTLLPDDTEVPFETEPAPVRDTAVEAEPGTADTPTLAEQVEQYNAERMAFRDQVLEGLTPEQKNIVEAMETAGWLFRPTENDPIYFGDVNDYPVVFTSWEDAYAFIDSAELKDTPGLREKVQAILHPAPTPQPEVTETPVAFYSGEQNGLPFDVEIRTLSFDEPEPPAPAQEPAPEASTWNVVRVSGSVREFLSGGFDSEAAAIEFAESIGADGTYLDENQFEWGLEVEEATAPLRERVVEPDLDEILDENPISVEIDGEWQTFPNRDAAEQAMLDASTQAPQEPQNFHITDDDLGAGGPKAKFRANVEAIRLLNDLEFSNRLATPAEQEVLSRYVGWGGIPQAFDENNADWAKEYAELKELLSPAEYESARGSVLNAHYTSPTVIHAIYESLGNMGFTTGNVLEPACGVGNFFGCLPETMQDSRLYGVELDSLTGRIAKQLYQKANITIDGFERTSFPNDFFDVVVGNVPFGNYGVADKAYDRHKFLIHDYFLAKSLDQVRTGGVVAVLTSSGTLDKKDTSTREYLAQRADLLGAIRLPNNAFRRNAGTDVVADILFLQKRDRAPLQMPEWVRLGQTEDGHSINQYFISHPEMVLGELTTESTQYGKQELTVAPIPDADLSEQLKEAISHIHGSIQTMEITDSDLDVDDSIPAEPDVANFSFAVRNGQIYFRENSQMTRMDLPAATAERVKGMVELRDTVRTLLKMQLEDYGDAAIHAQMGLLNSQYDQFTAKYGLINSPGNRRAFQQDSSYFLLSSLEDVGEDGKLKAKADIFTKRTIKKAEPVTSVDTAVEALAVSMGEKAHVDLDYMSELYGKSPDKICEELRGLIFQDPITSQWQTADEFLSGNVRQKLKISETFAENNPAFAINVEALRQVQPKDLTAGEIDVRLGVIWIEPAIITQFMKELLGTPSYMIWRDQIKVLYAESTGEWNIKGKSLDKGNVAANMTYGTSRASAYRLLEDALNQRQTKIYDTVQDADDNERRVINRNETILAQQKQDAIKAAFQEWIFKDPRRRETLVTRYNERFNCIRPRDYDGSHLTFPGMNPQIELRPHQKNVVAHILYGGNTLAAHAVGAGKTFSCIAAAMESKRLGLCQKSLFVVPNHLLEQWGTDILRLYPDAKVLVATKKDFEPANRKRFCSRIATGDYDAVVIGHTQFEKIPLSVERQKALLEQQIAEVMEGISEVKEANGERFTIKQMEATKKRLEARLKKLTESKTKDDVVTFEELGVDRLFVDESQNFKNLYTFTKMQNVAGVSTTDAQKSSDMYMKCQYMDEITGGRGITFATGTPISNSMTELYTLMRYLQADMLRDMHLTHFDSWAAQFGEAVTAIELTPEGTGYRAKTRFARFFNLPELMSIWKECADIQTSDMLKLPVPEAVYENIVVQPSDIQEGMVEELADRAERIHRGMVDASEDNMLCVTNDGRKLALDQRLINPMLPDDPDSKVNACVEQTFQLWESTAAEKSAQVIFCDQSTPKGDGTFNVYDDIKAKLVARGVPESEIAFIHDAATDAQKAALFSKVRSGQVRVILGSTSKMGAGTNIQDRLVALHHLDVPWRPSDVEQQEGRILRQGNGNDRVHIFRYITERTFDAYMWQILENKQKFIGQVMTSKSPARSCEDTDETSLKYAEVKALASGNPLILEKTELDTAVTKLKLMKADFTSRHYQLEDMLIHTYPKQIAQTEALLEGLQKDKATAAANLPPDAEHFQMTIAGKVYTDRKEAGTAIIAACAGLKAVNADGVIGEYAGFTMSAQFDSFSQLFRVTLKGDVSHQIEVGEDPSGNITRINNALTGIDKKLSAAQQRLEGLQENVAKAREELARPFPQEAELAAKLERLSEVNAALDLDVSDQVLPPEADAQAADAPKRHSTLTHQQAPAAETPPPEPRPATRFEYTPRQDADAPKRPSVLARLSEAKARAAGQSAPDAAHHKKDHSL